MFIRQLITTIIVITMIVVINNYHSKNWHTNWYTNWHTNCLQTGVQTDVQTDVQTGIQIVYTPVNHYHSNFLVVNFIYNEQETLFQQLLDLLCL